MAVSVVQAWGSQNRTASSSLVVSGATAGNVLLAFKHYRAAAGSYSVSLTNYTQLNGAPFSGSTVLAWRIATGDSNDDLVWTATEVENTHDLVIELTGNDAISPIDDWAYDSGDGSGTVGPYTVNPTADGFLLHYAGLRDWELDTGDPTPDAALTLLYSTHNGDFGTSALRTGFAAQGQAFTGTASQSNGWTRDTATGMSGSLFAIKEASGGGTTVEAGDVSQGQSIGNVTLTQSNVLQINSLSQGQSVDSVTLTQEHQIAPNAMTQGQPVDNITLTQAHIIVPNGLVQSQAIDNATLTQEHTLTPESVTQDQTADNVTLASAGTLNLNGITQAQTIDEALLTVAGVLTVQGVSQAQILDGLELTQAHILALQGMSQGQSIDSATLSANALTLAIQDMAQGQALDNLDLTQASVLSVNGMTQAQIIDAVTFGGLVIGELEGQIVVYAALGGAVYSFPALSGTIH